jgi:hypothetical protein
MKFSVYREKTYFSIGSKCPRDYVLSICSILQSIYEISLEMER